MDIQHSRLTEQNHIYIRSITLRNNPLDAYYQSEFISHWKIWWRLDWKQGRTSNQQNLRKIEEFFEQVEFCRLSSWKLASTGLAIDAEP